VSRDIPNTNNYLIYVIYNCKSLSVSSQHNYIPGYIIEDESNDTSHEIGTLEAVDSEILGDYDACLYPVNR
jgi:hypothetical protein